MSHHELPNTQDSARKGIGQRIYQLGFMLHGRHGDLVLSQLLDIPYRTWQTYQLEESMPAEVVLDLIDITDVRPSWLLYGDGSPFQELNGSPSDSHASSPLAPGR